MPLNHHIQLNMQESELDTPRASNSSVSQIEEQDRESKAKKWGDIDTFSNELSRGPQSQSISLGLYQPLLSASKALQSFQKQHSHYINKVGSSSDGEKEKASVREERSGIFNVKLSTDQIMRLAGERFIEFAINTKVPMHPYCRTHRGLSVEDKLDVELVELLLRVAEEVSHKETDRACRLLSKCQNLASNAGTPVQRTVFYFAEALAKKIQRETCQIDESNSSETNTENPTIYSNLKHQSRIIAWYRKLPFPQVIQFAGVQALLENIKMNSKVHMIDIQMRTGVTWAVMMQALAKQAGYNVKQLKLTVIETIDKKGVEASCTHLQNFAKTLNLMFSYQIILVSDMKELSYNQFEVEADEVIVAYAPFVLRTMIARPLSLERLMNVMKRLNPSVMVITEVEANHNSPSFANRFIEAFFYYGAEFECLGACMESSDPDRMAMEAEIFRHGIYNIVAAEGSERVTRSVKYQVWKAYFERFGMAEAELSESCLFQAQLVLQTFPCANSCNLGNKGKGIVAGWKGTPLYTLSAWSFT